MSRVYRIYPNKLGADPAAIVEKAEPQRGYTGRLHRYQAPSPKAAILMDECVSFAILWANSIEHAVARRWNREDAVRKRQQNEAHCRHLNIQLLREYLPNLKGLAKMRARYTIAHLETLQRSL